LLLLLLLLLLHFSHVSFYSVIKFLLFLLQKTLKSVGKTLFPCTYRFVDYNSNLQCFAKKFCILIFFCFGYWIFTIFNLVLTLCFYYDLKLIIYFNLYFKCLLRFQKNIPASNWYSILQDIVRGIHSVLFFSFFLIKLDFVSIYFLSISLKKSCY
jgi:hypothetical protein